MKVKSSSSLKRKNFFSWNLGKKKNFVLDKMGNKQNTTIYELEEKRRREKDRKIKLTERTKLGKELSQLFSKHLDFELLKQLTVKQKIDCGNGFSIERNWWPEFLNDCERYYQIKYEEILLVSLEVKTQTFKTKIYIAQNKNITEAPWIDLLANLNIVFKNSCLEEPLLRNFT